MQEMGLMIRPSETAEFGIFTGAGIYEQIAPKEPIIEGILNCRDNLVISSRAGAGKSILALQLVCSLTSGEDFLDTFNVPKPRNVLYVQTEGDRAETVHRLGHMKKALRIDDNRWAHYNAVGITLNTLEGLGKFMRDMDTVNMMFDVIIIDPLYSTIRGSINADDVATDWQRATRIIRERSPNASYIVFHHEPSKEYWTEGQKILKPDDDIMGTSMWGAWMSANYKMSVRPDGIRVLKAGKGGGKGRTGQGVSEIHMRLCEPSPLMYMIDDSSLGETAIRIWSHMCAQHEKRFRRAELEDVVERSKPTVCRVLSQLIKEGKIEKVTSEGLVYYVCKTQ